MVNLTKGQTVSLKKEAPGLKNVLVGLGWDPVKGGFFGSLIGSMDIDSSVICIDDKGRHESTVYYGDLTHRSGAIRHCGDNLTGAGKGDDEQIIIDLNRLPANIQKLAIVINIYQAYDRNQDFGKVKNCFVHVSDCDTGNELVRYDVDGNFDGMTGIVVAELYRYNGEFKFKAIGSGLKVKNINGMVRELCK